MEYIIRYTNNSRHMGPFPFSMHVWPYATDNELLMRKQFDTTGYWLNCQTEHKWDKDLKGVYDEVKQIANTSEIYRLMQLFWRRIYKGYKDEYLKQRIPHDLPVMAQLVCRDKDKVSCIPFYISQAGLLINNIGEIINNVPFRFQHENQIDQLESGPIVIDRIENDWADNAWLYWRRLKTNELMVDGKMNQIWPLDENVGKMPIAMINLIRGYSLSK